jgi:hypothetical protein
MIPGQVWRVTAYWPGGVRHEGGASSVCGFCTERGKVCRDTARAQRPGDRENPARKLSGRVLSTVARALADRLVVVGKPLQWGWSEGAGSFGTGLFGQPEVLREERDGRVESFGQAV